MATGAATKRGYKNASSDSGKKGNEKKKSKNPYADLGREKFSALVNELEEEKKRILSHVGRDSVSLVRFVHSEDNKLKPILVLAKGAKGQHHVNITRDIDLAPSAADTGGGGFEALTETLFAVGAAEKDVDRLATEAAPTAERQPVTVPPAKLQLQPPAAPSSSASKAAFAAPLTPRGVNRNTKNPYANIGLDKFNSLLGELEEKKQEILSQANPEQVSAIRFSHSEDNKLKPVVITSKVTSEWKVETGRGKGENNKRAATAVKEKAPPTPREINKDTKSKNPYSSIGLDKFNALLGELEEKKQKILSQTDPEQVLAIRFSNSGDNKLKPVVITSKGANEGKVKTGGSREENLRAAAAEDKEKAPATEEEVDGLASKAAAPTVEEQLVAVAPRKLQPPAATPTTASKAAAAPLTLRRINTDTKNPYSNIGLDKFNTLLDELEEKKQKILSQTNPELVSAIRFSYSEDNKLKPVVITSKGTNEGKLKKGRSRAAAAAGATGEEKETAPAPEKEADRLASKAAAATLREQPDRQIVAAAPTLSAAAAAMLRMSNKDSKNPYANIGLEKFSALLAQLEESKKQKIISQISPDAKTKKQRSGLEEETKKKNGIKGETNEPAAAKEAPGDGVGDDTEDGKSKLGCEKWKVYAFHAADCGCAIVIVILVVLFLALHEKYKSTVYLLELQRRLCQS